jgi:hypothetical protein
VEVCVQSIVRPRFGKLATAVFYSGRSRSRIYEWAAKYKGLIRKEGSSSIVDFDMLDAILDGLPPAEIKTKAAKSAEARKALYAAEEAAPKGDPPTDTAA